MKIIDEYTDQTKASKEIIILIINGMKKSNFTISAAISRGNKQYPNAHTLWKKELIIFYIVPPKSWPLIATIAPPNHNTMLTTWNTNDPSSWESPNVLFIRNNARIRHKIIGPHKSPLLFYSPLNVSELHLWI